MKIQKITVTDAEVNEAVQEFLEHRFGVKVEVKKVKKQYSFDDEWEVEIVVEKKSTPAPLLATHVDTDPVLLPTDQDRENELSKP